MERHDIRKFRDRHKLSQEQLASKIGSTPRSVRRWENGHVNPSDAVHEKLQQVSRELEQQMAARPTASPPVRRTAGPPPKAGAAEGKAVAPASGPQRRVAHLPGDLQGERTLAPLAGVLPSMGRV